MNFYCSNLQHSVHKMSRPKVHENVNRSYGKKLITEKDSGFPGHVLFLSIFKENKMLLFKVHWAPFTTSSVTTSTPPKTINPCDMILF